MPPPTVQPRRVKFELAVVVPLDGMGKMMPAIGVFSVNELFTLPPATAAPPVA